MLVNMLAEFVENFEKVCNENRIDILNEFWDNKPDRKTDSVVIELIYAGTVFSFEIYIWNNEVYAVGGITYVMLKGVEYYAEHFSMIESEELEDGPANLEEIIDFITNCEVRKKMIKLAHTVDDFFESFDGDREQKFIKEYIRMHYDIY
jgi:hypothetical protein